MYVYREPVENVHANLVADFFLAEIDKLRSDQPKSKDPKYSPSIQKQLERQNQLLKIENKEARQQIIELTREKEILTAKANSKVSRRNKSSKKTLEVKNSNLQKVVASLKSQLQRAHGKLKKKGKALNVKSQQECLKAQRLIRKIKEHLFRVTDGAGGVAPAQAPVLMKSSKKNRKRKATSTSREDLFAKQRKVMPRLEDPAFL
ncbi:hypothetical protein AAMO2058_000587100 [Amorphochlora amoebiformis]